MKEIRFSRSFSASEQRQYVNIPFDVPAGIDRIEFFYEYPRFRDETRKEGSARIEANIVDLGIYDDSNSLRGWSGSQRYEAFVSESSATPGYKNGPIRPGSWAIALGIYKVESKVTVDVTIRLIPKARILLAGDIHMHTLNSDGDYPTTQVIEFCRRLGLDFMALTDHNNTEQNKEIGKPEGITVIPGMEYTNYRGHSNFFFRKGMTCLDCNPLSNSHEEMVAVMKRAKEKGSIISLNHPHCDNVPWEFGFDSLPYDMVELWNGPMKPADMRTVAWWHSQLSAGLRLPGVGGSDTHRIEPNRTYGCPSTFVHAASRSVEDILDALKAGRSFITAYPTGPRLDLHIGDAGLGENATILPGMEGLAELENAQVGDILLLLDGIGNRKEWCIPFSGSFHTRFFADNPKARFYRLELYRERLGVPTLTALSNPVYLNPQIGMEKPTIADL